MNNKISAAKAWMHKRFRNTPLRKKILLLVMVGIIILGLVNIWGLNALNNTSIELLHQTTASALSYSASDIADALDSAATLTGLIATNSELQNCIATFAKNGTPSLYQQLYSIFQVSWENAKQPIYSRMALYFSGYELEATRSGRIQELPQAIKEELDEIAKSTKGRPVFVTKYSSEYGIFLLRSIRQIAKLDLSHLGTLVLQIDPDLLLQKNLSYVDTFNNSAQVLFDDQIFFTKSTFDELIPASLFESKETYFLAGDGKFFVTKSEIPGYDWQYGIVLDYSEMTNALTNTRLLSFVTTCISGFLVLFVLNLVINSLLHHFDVLMKKMASFDGEKYDSNTLPPYDYSNRKDELGLLHQKFDAMVLRIQQLIHDNYLKELLYTEAQLKTLETQLDPHFLYNTLELINWQAKAAHVPEISRIAESLGGMLRVVLDKRTHTIPLSREITLVKNYLTIQQCRFEDRLCYEFDVDEALLEICIPKLTIQPLVENAIRYGLERTSGQCTIRTQVFLQGGKLHIIVRNTNSAFDDDLLERLKSNDIATAGFGIGILNIYQRLQLHYQEKSSMQLENIDGCASVHISIPYEE